MRAVDTLRIEHRAHVRDLGGLKAVVIRHDGGRAVVAAQVTQHEAKVRRQCVALPSPGRPRGVAAVQEHHRLTVTHDLVLEPRTVRGRRVSYITGYGCHDCSPLHRIRVLPTTP
jgi:hypothetical protein